MGDTRDSREDRDLDADRRDRERAVREELERFADADVPADLEADVDALDYPATAEEVAVAAEGYGVETAVGSVPAPAAVLQSGRRRYESPRAARRRLRRPSVAVAMRRLADAAADAGVRGDFEARRAVYEKTLRALEGVDADDDDEGVAVLTAWLADRVADGDLPSSRETRRRAAEFCRNNDYPVSDNSWLGA